MQRSDYDFNVAFDDICDEPQACEVTRDSARRAMAAIIGAAGRKRFVLGADAPKQPQIRVDDEETYAAFRKERCAPYVEKLVARIDALQNAQAEHEAHGHHDLEARFDEHVRGFESDGASVDACENAVIGALGEVGVGGQRVPLPLPDWAKGKVDCWQDGKEILCTIRILGNDGQVKLLTTGEDLDPHVDEILGYAAQVDVSPEEAEVVCPPLVQVMAGNGLVRTLCGVAAGMLKTPPVTMASRYLDGTDVLISLGGLR